MPPSNGRSLGEETYFTSLASDGAGVTTPSLDRPFISQTQVKALGSQAPLQSTSEQPQPQYGLTNQISSLITTTQPDMTAKSICSQEPASSMSSRDTDPPSIELKGETFCPDAVNQAGLDATEDSSHQHHASQGENQKSFGDQQETSYSKYLSRTTLWSSTASLPRGYRRSEGSLRLSSAVTAKPFGTKQSRVSSLPRQINVSSLSV